MKDLTTSQMRVLSCIAEYIGKYGYAPTIREIMRELGYKSTSNVHDMVTKLIDYGYLESDHPGRPRALRLGTKYIVQMQKEAGQNIWEGFLAGIKAMESECQACEYYDCEDDYCKAFECNGIECPELPCEIGEVHGRERDQN